MSVRQSSGGATAIVSTRVASLLGAIVIFIDVLDNYETNTIVMVPSLPNPFRTCDF